MSVSKWKNAAVELTYLKPVLDSCLGSVGIPAKEDGGGYGEITIMYKGVRVGALTLTVDETGVMLALKGVEYGTKGRATASWKRIDKLQENR